MYMYLSVNVQQSDQCQHTSAAIAALSDSVRILNANGYEIVRRITKLSTCGEIGVITEK